MTRILKYLGRQSWLLVLALACVAGQAFFELQLPDQMARLVNIGVQAHGVENCAPARVTPTDFELARTFMSAIGRRNVDTGYHEADGVLVRDEDLDAAELSRLNNVFSIASCAMVYAAHELPGEAGNEVETGAKSGLSEINAGPIRQELLDSMPLPSELVTLARSRALAMQADLRLQMGQAVSARLYEEAGGSLARQASRFMAGETTTLFGLAAAAMAFSILVSVLAARASSTLADNLRKALFAKTHGLSQEQVRGFTKASLLARTTSDINLVQMFVMAGTRILAFALIMGVGGAVLAGWSHPRLAWTLAAAILGVVAVILVIFGMTRPRYRTVQKMIDRLNLVAREDVDGPCTIRAYGGQSREEQRFDDANELLADTQLKINRRLIFLSPSFTLISNLVGLFIAWYGAFQVQSGTEMVGNLIAYGQYATVSLAAFALVAGMFIVVPRVTVSAERILDVLDAPEPKVASSALGIDEGGIQFRSVSYTYPGREAAAVSDATISAMPGEVTAVIGRTGSGKSTLAALLERFVDAQKGGIYLNGRDIASMPVEELREDLTLVPQRADWASGWGQLLFQDGLEGRWSSVSNEQAVLGALGGGHPAYVVDDALAHLDPQKKREAAGTLRKLARKSSVLLLSHSVRDAACADRIYVMDGGRVVACGTHAELMKGCELYQRLAEAEQVPGMPDA